MRAELRRSQQEIIAQERAETDKAKQTNQTLSPGEVRQLKEQEKRLRAMIDKHEEASTSLAGGAQAARRIRTRQTDGARESQTRQSYHK